MLLQYIFNKVHQARFTKMLQKVSGSMYAKASAQGDCYFYLEQFNRGNPREDSVLAKQLGETVIDTYCTLLRENMTCQCSHQKAFGERGTGSLQAVP